MNIFPWRSRRPSSPFTHERLNELMSRSRGQLSAAESRQLLEELIALHHEYREKNETVAEEVRRAFLLSLGRHMQPTETEKPVQFLIEHVQTDDYRWLRWRTPQEVVRYCETLYSFPFEDAEIADAVSVHVHALLRHALQEFEKQGEYEKMFQLLQVAPLPPTITDPELLRLRNRAYLYEQQRIRRGRRILYSYLVLQVLLMTIVFPLLFINAENGAIQRQIEQATEVEIPEDPELQFFAYRDGLYWSIITAASIGYGDITPVTRMGKLIAATLGTMGVVTIGVVAGLILSWITPRQIE